MLQPISAIVPFTGNVVGKLSYTSVVKFDPDEELLWTGNFCGHISSFYSYELARYSSFHLTNLEDLRCICVKDDTVLSLTENTLALNKKGGYCLTEFTSESMSEMQCMKMLPTDLMLIGGHHNKLLEFDISRGKVLRTTRINEEGCVIIRSHPQFICCGSLDGKITMRDPRDLKVKQTFTTHSITLSDFDVQGNYIVTCGYSNKNFYTSDRFLLVYDIRMNKHLPPIIMVFPPYLLRFIPAFSSRFFVVSQTGQFQTLDVTKKLDTPMIGNLIIPPCSSITSFDISSSCQSFAFSDNTGYVYLYGSNYIVKFNNYSKDTEFPETSQLTPYMSFDEQKSFSSIPFIEPTDKEPLLSEWPKENCKCLFRFLKPIDEEIIKTMKMKGNVGYAQKSSKFKTPKLPCYTEKELDELMKENTVKCFEEKIKENTEPDFS